MEFHLNDLFNFLTLIGVMFVSRQNYNLKKDVEDLADIVVEIRSSENRKSENDLNSRLEELQTMRFSPLRIVQRNQ